MEGYTEEEIEGNIHGTEVGMVKGTVVCDLCGGRKNVDEEEEWQAYVASADYNRGQFHVIHVYCPDEEGQGVEPTTEGVHEAIVTWTPDLTASRPRMVGVNVIDKAEA